jgi:hypothetical protein
MSKILTEIAEQLKDANKKVQLIYAFNGTGKTRLSREFKQLIAPKNDDVDEAEQTELSRTKILYYNAFTEDLFYWDNDLYSDAEPKLKIQPNSFTDWIFENQGLDRKIIDNFQSFTGTKAEPHFDITQGSITFKIIGAFSSGFSTGFNTTLSNLKISKGEESNLIWSIFYTFLQAVIDILNIADPNERETDQFDQLEYVFIDDPVSSLDENHLIELAVNLAGLIKSSEYKKLKFIITTHNPLFYNVLYNEINKKSCYLLERFDDGTFALEKKDGDSNKSFSYHLYLKQTIEKAVKTKQIQKYHFTLLRNLYEKTANFLGYEHWTDLLETARGEKEAYLQRIITFSSHRTLSNEEVAPPTEPEKNIIKVLLDNLIDNYGYCKNEETI